MRSGIVLEEKGQFCIVLTREGEYLRIRRPRGAKPGDEICVPAERRKWGFAAMVAVAAMILFLFMPLPPGEISAYVSIDVNPSIEAGIDARDRVVEVTSFNEDGRRVLEAVGHVRGLPAEDLIRRVARAVLELGYMEGKPGYVLIGYAPAREDSGAQSDAMVSAKVERLATVWAEETPGNVTQVITPVLLTAEAHKEARNMGLSIGKYAVMLARSGEGQPFEALSEEGIPKAVIERILEKVSKKEELERIRTEKKEQGGPPVEPPGPSGSSGNQGAGQKDREPQVPAGGEPPGRSKAPAPAARPRSTGGEKPGDVDPGRAGGVNRSGHESGSV
ncbi:MAG: anti-sigma factor domain-containing protein [Bacillota bacterium]